MSDQPERIATRHIDQVIESVTQMGRLSVNMKDYVDVRVDLLHQIVKAGLSDQKASVDKADMSLQHRLAMMNEFREALRDQTEKCITRVEADARVLAITQMGKEHETKAEVMMAHLSSRIQQQELFKANLEGRLLIIAGIWGLVLLVLDYIIRVAYPH